MQRIQKFLAQYGIASRRTIEDWIKLQRIKIDGKIAKVGDQINGSEEIRLDNKILEHKNFTNTDNAIKILPFFMPFFSCFFVCCIDYAIYRLFAI